MAQIKVVDNSHDYTMLLRFAVLDNVIRGYWFDIVDNTELNF
jgi:hypothetical protein